MALSLEHQLRTFKGRGARIKKIRQKKRLQLQAHRPWGWVGWAEIEQTGQDKTKYKQTQGGACVPMYVCVGHILIYI
jgi:hypothetical protein